jgi:hypothetical protein
MGRKEPTTRLAKLAADYGIDSAEALRKLAAIGEYVKTLLPPEAGANPRPDDAPASRPYPPEHYPEEPPREAPDWLEYKRMLKEGQVDVGPPELKVPPPPPLGRCDRCGSPRDRQGCVSGCAGDRNGSVWATPNNVGRGKRSR